MPDLWLQYSWIALRELNATRVVFLPQIGTPLSYQHNWFGRKTRELYKIFYKCTSALFTYSIWNKAFMFYIYLGLWFMPAIATDNVDNEHLLQIINKNVKMTEILWKRIVDLENRVQHCERSNILLCSWFLYLLKFSYYTSSVLDHVAYLFMKTHYTIVVVWEVCIRNIPFANHVCQFLSSQWHSLLLLLLHHLWALPMLYQRRNLWCFSHWGSQEVQVCLERWAL